MFRKINLIWEISDGGKLPSVGWRQLRDIWCALKGIDTTALPAFGWSWMSWQVGGLAKGTD
jgi:hypothetical protein